MTKTMLTTVACVIGFFAIQAQGAALAEDRAKPPVTGAATKITQTSAVLTGTFFGKSFATMAWGSSAGGYDANCGPLPTPGAQSCTAQPLKCGKTYHYIASQDVPGKDRTFTTLACK